MPAEKDAGGLLAALAAFQAETPTFKKSKTARVQTRTGGEYTYKYADLGDILPTVGPLLSKHGLSWSSKPGRAADGELVLTYRLGHVSGEEDIGEMSLGVDPKCKPQELGSAITYARRYALTAQLNIATDEDDDGAAASRRQETASRPANGNVPVVNAEGVAELQAAAKGLTGAQVKLALSSHGLTPPQPATPETAFNAVPKSKAAELAKTLAGVERKAAA